MVLKLIAEFFENDFKNNRCFVGVADLTLYPDGEVALCEMLKPFGNIRDYDLNLISLFDRRYETYRKNVKGCSCTHDCNIASMLKFEAKYLAELIGIK